MPSTLRDICFDCKDAQAVGGFWQAVLGGELGQNQSGDTCVTPPDSGGLRYWFNQVPEPKTGKNRLHIDINMPDEAEMKRLLDLGATKIQEIRDDDGALWWTVMADIEGNEFCAFPPKDAS